MWPDARPGRGSGASPANLERQNDCNTQAHTRRMIRAERGGRDRHWERFKEGGRQVVLDVPSKGTMVENDLGVRLIRRFLRVLHDLLVRYANQHPAESTARSPAGESYK